MAKLQQKSRPKSSMSSLLNSPGIAQALGDIEEEEVAPPVVEPISAPALRIVEPLQQEPKAVAPAVQEVSVQIPPYQEPISRPFQVAPLTKTTGKSSIIRGGELYLTERSNQMLNELVSTFKTNINRSVASTHVLRGILLALQPHLSQIKREAAELGPMKRPSNETPFALEREEFEKAIGQAILRAVRGLG